MYPNGCSQDWMFQRAASRSLHIPSTSALRIWPLHTVPRMYKIFCCGLKKTAPVYAQNSLVHSHCLCKALMHHTMASIDQLPSTNSQPELSVLQIPNQWWIPKVARTPELQDTSLAYIIWKQLEADSATILLPKYLLVVYQMSM